MKRERRKGMKPQGLVGLALAAVVASGCAGDEASKPAVGSIAGGHFGAGIDDSLDRNDRRYMLRMAQNALEFNRTWEVSAWRNPDTGAEGTVTPTRTYESVEGKWCREFETTVSANDAEEVATGHACRERDGTWRIIEHELGAERGR